MKTPMLVAALAALTYTMTGAAQTAHAAPQSRSENVRAEVAVTYTALRTNAPVGSCSCFWTEGGTIQLAVPVWKFASAVGEFSGVHTGNIPGFGEGLTLISGTGGVRIGRPLHTRYTPFAQALFGVVHATDSYFPGPVTPQVEATSFTMTAGGGVDLALTKHFAARLIQADYHYMQLPNGSTNEQHDIRLSAGVVFRFTR